MSKSPIFIQYHIKNASIVDLDAKEAKKRQIPKNNHGITFDTIFQKLNCSELEHEVSIYSLSALFVSYGRI